MSIKTCLRITKEKGDERGEGDAKKNSGALDWWPVFPNLGFLETNLQKTVNGAASGADDHGGFVKWISCPHCEAPCRERHLPPRHELRCGRCGTTVMIPIGKRTFQPALALSIAGLLVLLLANTNPVLTFEVVGKMQSERIVTGVIELVKQGYIPIAFLVFFAGILAPALYLGSICYVSTACLMKRRLPMVRRVFELVEKMEPWNLIPVYSIATVVAVVKLKMLGTVEWQFGARWVLGVALFSLFLQQSFHRRLVLDRLEALGA